VPDPSLPEVIADESVEARVAADGRPARGRLEVVR
jgi:hypothetical protein